MKILSEINSRKKENKILLLALSQLFEKAFFEELTETIL